MDCREVIEWLSSVGTPEARESLTRYGIPNEHAFGVPMNVMKKHAAQIGSDHELALALWATGWYEARTIAAFIEDPGAVTEDQMDAWACDFDSWAICDTVCFHLFDKTPYAWSKVAEWEAAPDEFVRRASYALLWALSVHDKQAADEMFVQALNRLEHAAPDRRPLVVKAMDMALRATGKRNAALRREAIEVAERLTQQDDKDKSWVGKHALRELTK